MTTTTDPAGETAPVEGKVTAQWIGHALGLALAGFVSWALGVVCWHAPADAAHAPLAAAAVPAPVLGLVALIPLGVGFLFGYRAKHSPRPVDALAGELVQGPDLQAMITAGVAAALADRLASSADAALSGGQVTDAHGPETSTDQDSTGQDSTTPAGPGTADADLAPVRGNLTSNPAGIGTVGEQGATWATRDPAAVGGLRFGGPVSAAQSLGQES